ncbi:TonB system transport protein ExbD [Campylobacter sp. TTU-622]|uniref:TonB system transport protein ExbD n=1 Tax=unclassified Campylobacter TaxID=2593542 RepID=UPI0019071AB1|nr:MULTISPECIES: TonB system transport protein ExbD [unclassified Campylobacter]MBK1971275.1 TonB system transport protein ExbD [Campylobacter sp. TTU_617]MBK1972600.1 TonB system transport protein ExbD [Campylobacter sp. TTU-622]MBK1991116.1 TonB system transport protein ExbD [Campylobacter sp. 2018MI34]
MIKLPKNEGLNIVPFIDIMLVLLAIILSISTFIAQGTIKINLPSSQNSININDKEEKISIAINAQNIFYIDDRKISLDELKNTIDNLNPKVIVELKSDKDAKFESFVKIIDLLKAKNHENFQILTEKKND